jgi:hypothetical protein
MRLFEPGDIVKWVDLGYDIYNRGCIPTGTDLPYAYHPIYQGSPIKAALKLPGLKFADDRWKSGMIIRIDQKYQMCVVLNFCERVEEYIFIQCLEIY